MAIRYVSVLGVAVLLMLLGGCDVDSSSRSKGDPSAAVALGRWERVHGPPGGARGLQALVPVLAGERVVLIAGVDYDQSTVKALTFDPRSRRWAPAAPSHLWWRTGQTAVASGNQVILWGGCCGPAGRDRKASGAIYDAARDRWAPLEPGPLGNRTSHTAVWTGKEMIVWGGFSGSVAGVAHGSELRADGAAYDPRSDRWRMIAPAPLSPRQYHVAVWTGEEMIVWGGSRQIPREQERLLFDGAAYDPERDHWHRLAQTRLFGEPGGILGAGAEPDLKVAWTGEEMIVWGPNGGASYEPTRDRWERIPDPPSAVRVPYAGSSIVWTGEELIVWGGVGTSGDEFVAAGAAYDPQEERWTALPEAPIPGRDRHAAIWTGDRMLVWGGCCRAGHYHRDGAVYIPD
jgi:N-acetylneuraminic acid mutarotase